MKTTLPETMQAAAIDGFGGIERIKLHTLPVPKVGPADVLIRVEAAGVGSWDAFEREGTGSYVTRVTFPYVFGWDGAGTVAAVGERVSRFKVGDRVYAASTPLPRGGFYAEYAVVEDDHVAHIPEGLTIEQAAAMPWDALTALSGLEELDLKQDETLMIFGASGGIGHMAVQIAKRMGARVFAAASGDDGVAFTKRLGAEAAVDGRKVDVVAAAHEFAPGGVDAALVTFGGEATDRALMGVREGGRIACPHGTQPEMPNAPPGRRLLPYDGDRSPVGTNKLNQLIESGLFEVHVARTFTFDQVAEAHRALDAHYLGKLALRVS